MQTENFPTLIPKIEALPALPPPPAKSEAAPKPLHFSTRTAALQKLFRGICCAVALSVISLCTYQKFSDIYQKGIIDYLAESLLSLGGEQHTLCDTLSAAVLGNTVMPPQTADLPKGEAMSVPEVLYIPKKENIRIEEAEAPETSDFNIYSYDLSSIPAGFYPIIPTDASAADMLTLKNDTSYNVNMSEFSKDAESLGGIAITEEPLVLIVHTHGTESFSSEEHAYYSESFNHPRSTDTSKNIVAVGKTLCDALNEKGIPALHCETMHDKESYINAYDRSAESIQYYLEKYPSIRYVFDVHRDSLIRSNLTKLRPVTLKDGKPCAQIMMIIGSDEKGAGEYDWESNLVLATAIQQNLFNDAPSVSRHMYLRGASYNQQYAKHGLLLEIGSCGNTLAEAKEAALAFADAFEKVIK